MRRSTFLSFLVAAVLGVLAVIGVQTYLDSRERALEAQARKAVAPVKAGAKIVVATAPLRFGDRITPSKLKLIEWPTDSAPNGSFLLIEDLVSEDPTKARYVLSAMEEDEPVLSTKITNPGQQAKLSTALTPGMKAVSIRVNDVLGVAGFVLPGDRVDVLLTRGGRNSSSYVDVLLQGVRVLAIDQLADDRSDKPAVVRTMTFEVTTSEAQKLTLAASIGRLSLALRNIGSSGVEDLQRVSVADLTGAEISESLVNDVASGELDDGRLEGIEKAVQTVDERINEVETSLRSDLEEALRQRLAAAEAEAAGAAAPAPSPAIKKPAVYELVGVTKGGRRTDYKFKILE